MQKTIDQVWLLFQTIWLYQNGKMKGKDYDEQCAIALKTTCNKVQDIYQQAQSEVNPVSYLLLSPCTAT
jgi:hypothetical protein